MSIKIDDKRKLSVIILAGGEKGPLYKPTGHKTKALIPIHGKPMLDWVIDAFRADNRVGDIIVVGNEELDRCAGMRHVTQRVPAGFNLMQNIMAGVAFVRTMIHNESTDHSGYVISFCDAVFLNPEIVKDTLDNIVEAGADFHLHYVEKKSFEKEKLPTERTWIPVDGKNYTGSTIYYVRRFSLVTGLIETFGEIRHNRKDSHGLLRAIDCVGLSLDEIEKKVSSRIKATLKISISPHARLGMDVDKPADLELAQKTLKNPWFNGYKKGVIIYNPNSGSGVQHSPVLQALLGIKKRKFDEHRTREELMIHARDYLNSIGVPVELYPTEYAGHATEIAHECVKQGYNLIIAAGGDGTINEVINGMAETDAVLGVIPMGTANVLALELNLPSEVEAACEVIASGQVSTIDLGKAGDRYFSCMAGTGFDAHVIKEAHSKIKKVLGVLTYPIVALKEFLFYPFKKITVRLDDQPIPRKGYWLVVNNGKYYGGKMPLATFANMRDGYLDVTIFKYRGFIPAMIYILGVWHNRVDKLMSVEQFQCKRVYIEKGRGASVHVDAEYYCEAPIEIKVVPSALKVAR